MAEEERIYGERYPFDEDFLEALAHMPDACGMALGLDRLVMLATGAARIDQVLWAPLAGGKINQPAWRRTAGHARMILAGQLDLAVAC